MTRQGRHPAIVAELGRPETPEETAARKAAASLKRRQNQTVLNLLLSTAATLGVVAFLVAVVVRPSQDVVEPVDYRATAERAETSLGETLLAPALPAGWWANRADISRGNGGVTAWYVGLLTPDRQFLAITQGLDANQTWQAETVRDVTPTGERRIAGVTWTEYDRRDRPDSGNHAYALSTVAGDSTVVLYGTAAAADFELVATAIAPDLLSQEGE